jgi:hypothetical protein
MDKTLQGVLANLLGVLFLLFLIFGVGGLFVIHDLKKRAIPGDLKPTIEVFRSKCSVQDRPDKTLGRLTRPYALSYAGGIREGQGYVPFFDATSTHVGSASEVKTLILVKSERIGQATFGTPDNLTGYVNPSMGRTYYRYRYHLWAFDLANGRLGAYITLEDPSFQSEYRSSEPQHLGGSAFAAWADSVTDAPSVGGQR